LQHYEYLSPVHIDPRKELTEKLLSEIPEDACILTYNKAFETRILNGLAQMLPEHKEKIEKIIDNIRDLMVPFRSKDIYRRQMEGSYSLKYVLPALVPEMKYEGMEVSDGAMASSAWLNLWEIEDTKEIKRIRNALHEYCKLDTLAMVRILEKLREI